MPNITLYYTNSSIKLHGVGPVNNIPSIDYLYCFVQKKGRKKKLCDTRHATCDTWHMTNDLKNTVADMTVRFANLDKELKNHQTPWSETYNVKTTEDFKCDECGVVYKKKKQLS